MTEENCRIQLDDTLLADLEFVDYMCQLQDNQRKTEEQLERITSNEVGWENRPIDERQ